MKKKTTKKNLLAKKVRAKRKAKPKAMKIVYGVRWIEVEFGRRDEGYSLFLDKEECFFYTKESSRIGPYGGGGYLGPLRPLAFVEIPFESLSEELQEKLEESGRCHTPNHWSPRFTGERVSIK